MTDNKELSAAERLKLMIAEVRDHSDIAPTTKKEAPKPTFGSGAVQDSNVAALQEAMAKRANEARQRKVSIKHVEPVSKTPIEPKPEILTTPKSIENIKPAPQVIETPKSSGLSKITVHGPNERRLPETAIKKIVPDQSEKPAESSSAATPETPVDVPEASINDISDRTEEKPFEFHLRHKSEEEKRYEESDAKFDELMSQPEKKPSPIVVSPDAAPKSAPSPVIVTDDESDIEESSASASSDAISFSSDAPSLADNEPSKGFVMSAAPKHDDPEDDPEDDDSEDDLEDDFDDDYEPEVDDSVYEKPEPKSLFDFSSKKTVIAAVAAATVAIGIVVYAASTGANKPDTEPRTSHVEKSKPAEKKSSSSVSSVSSSSQSEKPATPAKPAIEVAQEKLEKTAKASNQPHKVHVTPIGGDYMLGIVTYFPDDATKMYMDYSIVEPETVGEADTGDKVQEIEKKLKKDLPTINKTITVKDGSKVSMKTYAQRDGKYNTVLLYEGHPFGFVETDEKGNMINNVTTYYVQNVQKMSF